MRTALAAISCCLATTVAGQPLLEFPLDCTLGETCYIQQFMDHDPGPAASDYTCAPMTYNGHKGTDFALPTFMGLKSNIGVKAAAAGTVLGVRDDMAENWISKPDADAIKGRDCGNGLVIDHGGGWQTQYCHMQAGSLTVKKGDVLPSGTLLGYVGTSGRTEFPHLHLSVRKNSTPVDPFAPDGATCGTEPEQTLWKDTPHVQPGGILNLGFSFEVPKYANVRIGTAEQPITQTSPAIVAYSYVFGGRANDIIRLTLKGPSGTMITNDYQLPKNRAQFFRAAGKKLKKSKWPSGTYVAIAEMIRSEKIISRMTSSFKLP